jgi:hypothetical protein
MNLTKKGAIKKFREQWAEMGKHGLTKEQYFSRHDELMPPKNLCWLCKYVSDTRESVAIPCQSLCPIDWRSDDGACLSLTKEKTLFDKWDDVRKLVVWRNSIGKCLNRNINQMKRLATLISKLPERRKRNETNKG